MLKKIFLEFLHVHFIPCQGKKFGTNFRYFLLKLIIWLNYECQLVLKF